MDLLESLNKKFNESYGKTIANLNKNIYLRNKLDGQYEAPVITLGKDGGYVVGKSEPVLPAIVSVELVKQEAQDIIYRLAIPRSEMEIADSNPAYFKYLIDSILQKALSNYVATVGSPDILRYGEAYLKVELQYPNEPVDGLRDGSDYILMVLSGSWAKGT